LEVTSSPWFGCRASCARGLAHAAVLLGVACGRVVATGPQELVEPSPLVIERLPFDPEEEMGHKLPPESMFKPLGREGCRPASPLIVTESLATSDEIKVWALFLANVPAWELGVGDEAKIVWRSDGTGDFRVVAISPTRKEVSSEFPVTSHLSSNWERPGSEWGSGFRFSEPGCWELRVRHGDASARLWLVVDE
jgi:hypothetical protein